MIECCLCRMKISGLYSKDLHDATAEGIRQGIKLLEQILANLRFDNPFRIPRALEIDVTQWSKWNEYSFGPVNPLGIARSNVRELSVAA